MIPMLTEPDTMVLPSGEKATDTTPVWCAPCFSALSSKDAAHKHKRCQVWAKGLVQGISADTPASQTLIMLSKEPPDMIVVPSGEKPTDSTQPLCAPCFSALSSREAAASTGAVRSGLRV